MALVRPLRRGPEPEIEGRAAPGRPADEFRDPSERAPGPQRVEQRIGDAAVEGRRSLRSLGDGRTLDLGGILLDQFLWLLIELPRDERCEDGGLRAEELNRCTQLFEQFGVAVEARELAPSIASITSTYASAAVSISRAKPASSSSTSE